MSTAETTSPAQIGYRLSRVRKDRGFTQAGLAELLEISRGYIADIEVGRTAPSRNFLEALVEETSVNAFWLLLGTGDRYRPDVLAFRKYQSQLQLYELELVRWKRRKSFPDGDGPPQEPNRPSEFPPQSAEEHVMAALDALKAHQEGSVELPVRGEDLENLEKRPRNSAFAKIKTQDGKRPYEQSFEHVRRVNLVVSAGAGKAALNEEPIGEFAFRRDWMRLRGLYADKCAVVEVHGESMLPRLSHGDLILINTEEREVSQGGRAYVLRLTNDLVVKFLSWLPDGNLQATSLNPAFQPFTITKAQLSSQEVEILGRVRSHTHDWE